MFARTPEARSTRPGAVLWIACAAALAILGTLALPASQSGSSSDLSPRQLMRFGVEAARQGLWREAVARWERAVKDDAANPRLRNNLAVAYESLGRFPDADREYREARRLAPDSREIKDNHASFLQMHAELKTPEEGGAPPAPKTGAPAPAPPAGQPTPPPDTATPAPPPAPGPPPPQDHP